MHDRSGTTDRGPLHAAQTLRLDHGAERPQGRLHVACHHRFRRKLYLSGAGRCSLSAHGFIEMVILFLITSGLAHLPPIKVVTILAGAAHVNIWLFISSAIIARGARFYMLAWLLRRYGEGIRHFIEHRLGLITAGGAAVLLVAYVGYKFLTH